MVLFLIPKILFMYLLPTLGCFAIFLSEKLDFFRGTEIVSRTKTQKSSKFADFFLSNEPFEANHAQTASNIRDGIQLKGKKLVKGPRALKIYLQQTWRCLSLT